jgi:hypothetical protein
MRRRGALDLLVVLPDGSRSLMAAAWTNLEGVAEPPAAGRPGSVEDLLAARRVLDGLLERIVRAEQEDRGEQAAEESSRAVALGSGGEPGAGQLERNVESPDRQYALVERAAELGFDRSQVVVIDEDLGISGSGLSERSGFARLTAEVALGHAGLVLGLEASRLARNNADWYRLLDLCGVTDTVIGDADGLYHPGSFNDRLLLGRRAR